MQIYDHERKACSVQIIVNHFNIIVVVGREKYRKFKVFFNPRNLTAEQFYEFFSIHRQRRKCHFLSSFVPRQQSALH